MEAANFSNYNKQAGAWHGATGFGFHQSHGTSSWEKSGPPYPYYMEAARSRTGYTVLFGKNAGRVYRYIDIFAYACRHEAKHREDFDTWWTPRWDAARDLDQDALRNDIEVEVGSNPRLRATFPAPGGINNWTDDQWYTLNHELEWVPGNLKIKQQDWAHPGAQHP